MKFVAVAEAASLPPGTGRTVHVGGKDLALYNVDGRFHAVDDQCPHRGASLGSGFLDGTKLYCPLHGWSFDVETGACFSNSERPIKTHVTRVIDGQVEIGIKDL